MLNLLGDDILNTEINQKLKKMLFMIIIKKRQRSRKMGHVTKILSQI